MNLIRSISILKLSRANGQFARNRYNFVNVQKEVSSPFLITKRNISNQDVAKTLLSDKLKLNESSGTILDKNEIDLTKIDLNTFNNPELASNLVETTDQTIKNVDNLNQILSATDIGLSSYLPPRLFYDLITYLHESTSLTWVTSILISCITLRICTFPLYVKAKKESAELSNNMMRMQRKVSKIDLNASEEEKLRHSEETMKSIYKVNKTLPRFLLSPIAQAVVFSSFYFCLRAMAQHPIQSMKSESFLWVPSLTESDPYFLFPFFTATTMFLMLKFNMETNIQTNNDVLKYMTFGFPLIVFTITCTFPANLTIYWFINNNITVLAHFLTRHPKAKAYFNIPEITEKPPDPNDMAKFSQTFKENLNNLNEVYTLNEKSQLIKKREEQKKLRGRKKRTKNEKAD